MTPERPDGPIHVCIGFPPHHEERYLERLRSIEGIVPEVLPIDPRPRDGTRGRAVHIAQQWLDQLSRYGHSITLAPASGNVRRLQESTDRTLLLES